MTSDSLPFSWAATVPEFKNGGVRIVGDELSQTADRQFYRAIFCDHDRRERRGGNDV